MSAASAINVTMCFFQSAVTTRVLPAAIRFLEAVDFTQIVSVYCSPTVVILENTKKFEVVSILNSAHSSSVPVGLVISADSKVFKLSPLAYEKAPPSQVVLFARIFSMISFSNVHLLPPVMRSMTDGSIRTFSAVLRNVHGMHLISERAW